MSILNTDRAQDIAINAVMVLCVVLVVLVGWMARDTYVVTRACLELGYASASPAHRMCRTSINGTDIVLPLEKARTLPRRGSGQ